MDKSRLSLLFIILTGILTHKKLPFRVIPLIGSHRRLIKAMRSLRSRDEVDTMAFSEKLGFQAKQVEDIFDNLKSLDLYPSSFSDIPFYTNLSNNTHSLIQLFEQLHSPELTFDSSGNYYFKFSQLKKGYRLSESLYNSFLEDIDASADIFLNYKRYFHTQIIFFTAIQNIFNSFKRLDTLSNEKGLAKLFEILIDEYACFIDLIRNSTEYLSVNEIGLAKDLATPLLDSSINVVKGTNYSKLSPEIKEDVDLCFSYHSILMDKVKLFLFEVNTFLENHKKLELDVKERVKTINSLEKMFDSWDKNFDSSEIYDSYLFCVRHFDN